MFCQIYPENTSTISNKTITQKIDIFNKLYPFGYCSLLINSLDCPLL